MQQLVLIWFLLTTVSLGFAIPKETKKDRIVTQPLSNSEHYVGEEHNPAYDHEAFLGEETAKTFDQLTPEESKAKLAEIVIKMDTNNDKFVSFDELRGWIQQSQKNYVLEDVDRQWKSHNPGNLEKITWSDYRKLTYGFIDDISKTPEDDDNKTYREMMRRDRRRWDLADKNKDDALSKIEFTDFLHPEEADHMRAVVVEETLEDIDKNNDGKLSLDEYISDMYSPEATGDQIPEWVTREKEQFSAYRDKNGDGFMDKDEIREWIIPHDYDHSEAEAKHLLNESDINKDNKLTKDEILENYDLFVGSQATDFGEALMNHDEF